LPQSENSIAVNNNNNNNNNKLYKQGYNSVFCLKIITCQQLQTWRAGELLRLCLTKLNTFM